jgi:hypothetical protein
MKSTAASFPKSSPMRALRFSFPSCLALALVCAVSACGSPGEKDVRNSAFAPAPDPNAPPPTDALAPKPWTDKFLKPAALVALDVRIEGPKGLLDHLATVQDPAVLDLELKTTSAGLLQTITFKKDAPPGGEIRAQLDQLGIAALRKLTILERPGPVDVLVVASGDAFWQEKGTEKELRSPTVRLEGKIAR